METTNKRKIITWITFTLLLMALSIAAFIGVKAPTLKATADQTNTVTLGEGILYVGGEDIVKAEDYTVNGNEGGSAVYSETDGKRILTLNDYAYKGPGYASIGQGGGIDYRGNGDLTIILKGESSIVKANDNGINYSHGIYFSCSDYESSLIIDGDGYLEISFDANRSGGKSNGIFCEPGSFVMNGGTVVSNAGRGNESAGIYADQAITFNGGSFTGNGYNTTAYESRGIYCSNITVNGGEVIGTAPLDNNYSAYGFDNSTLIINNGIVTAYGKNAFASIWGVEFGEQTTRTIKTGSDPNSATVVNSLDDTRYAYIQARIKETPHTHNDITFAAWESQTSLPTEEGSYYLTADVTIDSTWTVPSGTTNLCLNGHGITMTGTDSVVYVASNSTLNLYDKEGESAVHYFNVDSNSCATVNDDSGSNSFNGGYITGGKGKASTGNRNGGGIYIDGGTFNMHGGNVIGNEVTTSDNCGAGVFANDNAIFRMYGGSISYNYAQNAGCGIFGWHNSAIEIYGGEIAHNKTSHSYGSAISFWNQSGYTVSLKLYGGVIHDNLTGGNGGAVILSESSLTVGMKGAPIVRNNAASSSDVNAALNVYVGSKPINIEGALENTEKIGIRLSAGTGVFTSGWSEYMGKADPAEYFYSENEAYGVYLLNGEAAVLAEPPVQKHTHDDITFAAWESQTSLPTEEGNYYLTADVTIGSTWTVPQGTTNLCLNGHMIAAENDKYISVVTIPSGATLNLYDCDETTHYYYIDESTYKHNRADNYDKMYDIGEIAADGESNSAYAASTRKGFFKGGYITGGTGQGLTTNGNNISGGGFQIYGGGTLNMYGGCVFGNYTSATSSQGNEGGGVYVYQNGVFTMNGGYIVGNQGGNAGGGVQNQGTFTMNGGYIGHNTAGDGGWANGGGVVNSGTMIMNGGVIEGNEAGAHGDLRGKCGGGIFNDGSLTINGGSIINNFSDNLGGGIYNNGSLTIGADVIITGNYNKSTENADDVYLNTDKTITLSGALTENNPVSVKMNSGVGVFTSGWSEYMGDADPAEYFFSADDAYRVRLKNGEAVLVESNQFRWSIKIEGKAFDPSDYSAYIAEGEKVARVYDVTLYRIDDSGEQEPVSVQPSDIQEDFALTLKLTVPSTLIGKNFRILHVHAADD
ncbi:MAG: hypothetical protein IJ811_02105, partial [Clostridia bacterium]|nr:hypothetical protein [Clostridia bacterium]